MCQQRDELITLHGTQPTAKDIRAIYTSQSPAMTEA